MGQKRAILGRQYEKRFCEANKDWIIYNTNPKLFYPGEGRSVHSKIKNCNYDATLFVPREISLNKHDILNTKDGRIAEFKGYDSQKCNTPKLYCEFFKVATRREQYIHEVERYNRFVSDFYTYNFNNGFLNKIETGLMSSIDGIQLLDRFVPKCNLVFETKVVRGWAGFDRLTIMFHIKKPYLS
jgi:hypothetical protein